jgi:D-inositol-3-phosphate glycosyltransferase
MDKEGLRHYLPQFRKGVLAFQGRESISYDLIQSHYWLSGWVGQALKDEWGIPHVAMFHTLGEAKNRSHMSEREPDYRIAMERAVARRADRVICASAGEQDALLNYCRVPAGQVARVPCGVDIERFRPMDRGPVRAALGLSPDETLVLFVGRIEPLKGIDILVRASAQMECCFRILVVGGDEKDNERRAALRALAEAHGVAERVTFIDAVPHEELPLYYNASDISVVPSHYESFGMVALEAMACGIPVVATRVGGLRDTVRDGRTGYLVPWRCPEAFAERLDLLVSNESLRRSLGREAHTFATRFHWAEVAARVESVYHELVSQYSGVAVGAHVA